MKNLETPIALLQAERIRSASSKEDWNEIANDLDKLTTSEHSLLLEIILLRLGRQ